MITRDPSNMKSKRNPLKSILRGCAVVLVVAVGLLAANAIYWTARMGANRAGGQGMPVEQIRAQAEGLPAGDATRGERIFMGNLECKACHSLEAEQNGVGPGLDGMAERAAGMREGYSAQAYLYEAIVAPQAHVVNGYQAGIMPGNYESRLSPQELADLITFLMTR